MNAFRTWLGAVASVCLAAACLEAAARGDDRAFRREVTKILTVGWESPAKSLPATEEAYEAAKAAAPNDARAAYAFSLVHLKYRRYAKAIETLDQAIARSPDDLTLREARVWAALSLRQYGDALVQLEEYARRIGARAKALPAPAANGPATLPPELKHASETLGRMLAFAEKPGKTDVRRTAGVVEAELGETLTGDFNAGRLEVEDRHQKILTDGEKIADAVKESQTQRQVETDQKINEEKAVLAERFNALQKEDDAAQSEFDAKAALLRERLGDVERQLTAAATQARGLRNQLSRIEFDITDLRARASETDDENERDALLFRAEQLRDLQRAVLFDLAPLDATINSLQLNRTQLQSDFASLKGTFDAGRKARNDEAVKINGRGLRLNKEQERNATSVNGRSSAGRQQQTKAATIASYYEFPIEAERVRLLDELAKP